MTFMCISSACFSVDSMCCSCLFSTARMLALLGVDRRCRDFGTRLVELCCELLEQGRLLVVVLEHSGHNRKVLELGTGHDLQLLRHRLSLTGHEDTEQQTHLLVVALVHEAHLLRCDILEEHMNSLLCVVQLLESMMCVSRILRFLQHLGQLRCKSRNFLGDGRLAKRLVWTQQFAQSRGD